VATLYDPHGSGLAYDVGARISATNVIVLKGNAPDSIPIFAVRYLAEDREDWKSLDLWYQVNWCKSIYWCVVGAQGPTAKVHAKCCVIWVSYIRENVSIRLSRKTTVDVYQEWSVYHELYREWSIVCRSKIPWIVISSTAIESRCPAVFLFRGLVNPHPNVGFI